MKRNKYRLKNAVIAAEFKRKLLYYFDKAALNLERVRRK